MGRSRAKSLGKSAGSWARENGESGSGKEEPWQWEMEAGMAVGAMEGAKGLGVGNLGSLRGHPGVSYKESH